MADALKAFEEELELKNFRGYWQNVQGDVYREPVPSYEPCLWKGKDLFAAIEKAGEVVGLDLSFRRVIQLRNPSLKNGTSRTMVLNLQMLKPGEQALSHRHMAGAIRFILKGHGVRLIVEGEAFEIGEGDFVTTPSWTWHDHENHGGETMLWLDGLDAPLVRLLETDFHEPDPRKKQPVTRPEGFTPATVGALRPAWVRPNSPQPPAYCYRWEATELALSKVGEQPGDPYDGIVLEYANPLTGGPTLPTMSCQIQMLRPMERTRAHRHTSCAIYHVYRGAGATVIDGRRYEWEKGDSFVVPHWRHHSHENRSKDPAILFVMSDKPVMDALGHYREEPRS
ncbi:MAG TPA: cupin domain-containing protein [candidate division Zixibacteria bacterium]|nr:cupin domain-containing protein [candidate division Zixibacteria bacterium]